MNGSRTPHTIDVAGLPSYGFGHRSLMWWGTLGMMAIEGTVFALTVATYFYLRSHSTTWPMSMMPPELLWGTVNTVILLVSMIPNHLAKKAAEAHDVAGVRLWLCASLAFALGFLAVRVMEFTTLNVRWDSNAYGSVVWTLLGFHTAHLATDAADTIVLAVAVLHRTAGRQALRRRVGELHVLVLRGVDLDPDLPDHLLGRAGAVMP